MIDGRMDRWIFGWEVLVGDVLFFSWLGGRFRCDRAADFYLFSTYGPMRYSRLPSRSREYLVGDGKFLSSQRSVFITSSGRKNENDQEMIL